MLETADTWDSYLPTLEGVINLLKPKRALEFGSGKSTLILSKYLDTVDTVEHNVSWVKRNKLPDNVNMIFEPNEERYPLVTGRFNNYDLIFVDGIEREKCLVRAKEVLEFNGVVILHDAEREKYRDAINSYTYKIWEDRGHTVILTMNEDVYRGVDQHLR